jgi:hypothetical protein
MTKTVSKSQRIITVIRGFLKLLALGVPLAVTLWAGVAGLLMFVHAATLVDLIKGFIITVCGLFGSVLWFFIAGSILYD